MGNAGRLYILNVLRDHPMCVSEICQETGLVQSSVSRHLACLRNVGVVVPSRSGVEVVYQISDDKVVEVCDLVRRVLIEQIQKRSRFIV